MGNPHYVVFVDEFASDWQAFGAAIQHHPYFTQGVNVEFVVVRDAQNIDVRFFERGVGETQSSGTGSCASAVASITSGWAQSPDAYTLKAGLRLSAGTERYSCEARRS